MTFLYTYGVGWTYEDTQGLYMLCVIFCLYLLRNTSPFFEMLWNAVKLFIIITLVIVSAGMMLKWLKKFF